MRSGWRLIGNLLLMSTLGWVGLSSALPASADDLGDVRISLHPLGRQVGIVTSVVGATAWTRLPQRVSVGNTVEFVAQSDGTDVLATGQVRWVAPVPPYEAYITLIKPVTTHHDMNPYDDFFCIGTITGMKRAYGTVPESEGDGAYLSTGFFVRAAVTPTSADAPAVEPVRTYVLALRALNNSSATQMAAAAERALVTDPFSPNTPAEFAVDYTQLYANLRPFHRLATDDNSIIAHILHRLDAIVDANNGTGSRVSKDVLHYTPPLGDRGTTTGGVLGTQ